MPLMLPIVVLAALAAAVAERPSLFFVRSGSDDITFRSVLHAREVAAATGIAFLPRLAEKSTGSIALSAGADSLRFPPSGLLTISVEWHVPPSAGARGSDDVITVHCIGADDADFGDFLILPANVTAGSAPIRLLAHTACPLELRYIHGGAAFVGADPAGDLSACAVAAASAPIKLGNDTDVAGTRLAFGDGPGDIQLTWTSMNGTAPARARVGMAPGGPYPLVFTAGAPVSYASSDLCHAPANQTGIASYLFPGYFHTVGIAGLNASTRYYAVYGQDGGAEAPETTFVTRAAAGPDVPVRFAMFADVALYPVFPGTVTTVDMVLALDAAEPLDFVSIPGDLAYAEGSTLVWALWQAMVWPVTSRLPTMVTVGNHETNVQAGTCYSDNNITAQAEWAGPSPAVNAYGDDSGGEGGYPTFARFRAPAGGLGVLYYSFAHGSVHVATFSSEHDYSPGSAQHAWLAADLQAVDRAVTPWLVVAMHRPLYQGMDDSDWTIDQGMARLLEPLFLAAKVDLVLSGHYHAYLRTASMANYTADPTGGAPVYVCVGTGGATYHNESIRPDAQAWTRAVDAEWGFALVEARNRSALRVSFRANADGGAVHDEAWILRPERGTASE